MNTLKALREELSAALATADLPVQTHLPERIVPPLAVLAAGSPYVERGDRFGSFRVRFTAILVCATGPNEVTTAALDETVTAALVALDDSEFDLERVDQPMMLAHGNSHYLSAQVDLVRTVTGIDDGRA